MTSIINKFFSTRLQESDPIIYQHIKNELQRQHNGLELIASENLVSTAVLEAQGSILTNKYAEGYPSNRYYGGCIHVDAIEGIAIKRAKQLFNAKFANIQPHSGSQANQAVFMALLKPYDTIMSLSLDCGGHLTHGSKVNLSGKWFTSIHYNVKESDHLIDYNQAAALAKQHKPQLIIAGYSAYPRKIDFSIFREIADEVGAYFMVDMAHIAGLVAAGIYDNPLQYAHVVTSTTHKTLRGPRGGFILTNDDFIAKLINAAVFPGLQGGPMMHIIAAKAVAFAEAMQIEYKLYIKQVLSNANALATRLDKHGYDILTKGTDSHIIIVNLSKYNISGRDAERSLESSGLICNKNAIPFDKRSPTITSGIRLGSAACTTRGLTEKHFEMIGDLINTVLNGLKHNNHPKQHELERSTYSKVQEICRQFPIYNWLT